MKITTSLLVLAATAMLALPESGFAQSKKPETAEKSANKAKPYPLKTCIVTDEKLGDMGDPYVFVHEGQEIKLCCKSCQKDFKKDPAKYLKKVTEAEKKAKKS
jgi:hypothetical protein